MDDGEVIAISVNPEFSLRVIHTPGHTTDSVTYYSKKGRVAVVDDTIFLGSIGNDRYPGGNIVDLQDSILNKIFALPEETVLYSRHSEATSVGVEKRRHSL